MILFTHPFLEVTRVSTGPLVGTFPVPVFFESLETNYRLAPQSPI